MALPDLSAEWLETDGLGGFASGTVGGHRTRRYHALLLTDTEAGRIVHVNGFDAWAETLSGTFPISTQRYAPDAEFPAGHEFLKSFSNEPWPTWEFVLGDGITIRQEIFIRRGTAGVCLRWSVLGDAKGIRLHVRPFLSGRDYHDLHHENSAFSLDAEWTGQFIVWHPYSDLPPIHAKSNGNYDHHPVWYRNFLYEAERERGLDDVEDLASPGEFHWSLDAEPAVLLLATGHSTNGDARMTSGPVAAFHRIEVGERKRRKTIGLLGKSAEDYFARRGDRRTIIAGYPWFTDWGRDTFVALRGLAIAINRLDVTREILLSWADTVSEGMLPNRFPDQGEAAEFNSVDASLWYVVAVGDYLQKANGQNLNSYEDRTKLMETVNAILDGYVAGTRHGIRMDEDGLIACGEPGVQLTWMDAKVGDWVVTPRIGKPVEVQALWLNALWLACQQEERWRSLCLRAEQSFMSRFWNEQGGCLYDVVDVDHKAGNVDASFRPNQVFAVGGLPRQCLDRDRAQLVVDAVEERLLTPMGLRSLAPDDPHYVNRYSGGVTERDGAYHQGTVWPWLLGPFVEAWVRVRGDTDEAKKYARERFLPALEEHLEQAGIGHISEIADGDEPHIPRGCPFQAWSLGEFLRLKHDVLAESD